MNTSYDACRARVQRLLTRARLRLTAWCACSGRTVASGRTSRNVPGWTQKVKAAYTMQGRHVARKQRLPAVREIPMRKLTMTSVARACPAIEVRITQP